MSCSSNVLEHHLGKLIVRNLAVSVGVDLLDDLLKNRLVQGLAKGQYLLDFIDRDGTTTVFVKHLESSLQLVVGEQVLFVQGGNYKFRVFNFSTSVSINLGEHLVNLVIGKNSSEVFSVSLFDFVFREFSVAIDIHCSEHLINLLFFLL